MPETQETDRTPVQAKADAEAAIRGGATKVTLTRKSSGNWDLKITKP